MTPKFSTSASRLKRKIKQTNKTEEATQYMLV